MNSILILLLILLTASTGICLDSGVNEMMNQYQFLTHNPANISCDPYVRGMDSSLTLECSAFRTDTKTEPVHIVWFRTLLSQGTTENLNELAENTTNNVKIQDNMILPGSSSSCAITRSTLTIHQVINSEGTYWCAIEKQNQPNQLLVNYDLPRFVLKPPIFYDGLTGCPENAIHAVLGRSFSSSRSSSSSSTSSSSSSTSSTTLSLSSPSPSSTLVMDSSVLVKNGKKKRTTESTMTTPTSEGSGFLFNLSFLDVKGVVIISVVFGTLLCVVQVLLVCVCCMCCRKRRRKAKRMTKVASFQSTESLVLCRDTPTMPHINSPIPMTTNITSLLSSSSPNLAGNPPKHPPPKIKKMLPQPPQHSTMPLCHKISSSGVNMDMEQNIEARRAKRAATEQPSLNNLTGQLPIPTSYFAGTTGVEAQNFLRQDSNIKDDSSCMMEDNIYAAPFSDCPGNITPSNSAMGSTIRLNNLVNTSLPTCQDLDEDDIFADEEERKYKSLNRFTMDNHPLYDDPAQVCIDAEDGEECDAVQKEGIYASYNHDHQNAQRRHLEVPLGQAARESIDGEYVIPNDAFREPMDLSTNDDLDSDGELPEYIVVT